MESLHVYRLLLNLSAVQPLFTRIPPTIIHGYGFSKLTLIGGLPVKSTEGELNELLSQFLVNIPFAIMKCQGKIIVCGSKAEAYNLAREATSFRKAFVLQQFLRSATDRPYIVRLHWSKEFGVVAKLSESNRPYPSQFSPEVAAAYIVRADAGKSVKLSEYTKILVNSFNQLRNLIERICAEELDSLGADYIQDSKGNWHFLSVSSYSYTKKKVQSARSHSSVKYPITTATSPRYSIRILPADLPMTQKITEKKLKFRECTPGRPPYLDAPRRVKELQTEELVKNIAGRQGSMKHSSYKKWLQRTSISNTYLPLDRLFAKNIAKNVRAVYQSTRIEVENLKNLVRSLRRQQDANQIIPIKVLLFEVGRFLLNRLIKRKSRSSDTELKPITFTSDFQTLMSAKVLENGSEMLAVVQSRVRKVARL